MSIERPPRPPTERDGAATAHLSRRLLVLIVSLAHHTVSPCVPLPCTVPGRRLPAHQRRALTRVRISTQTGPLPTARVIPSLHELPPVPGIRGEEREALRERAAVRRLARVVPERRGYRGGGRARARRVVDGARAFAMAMQPRSNAHARAEADAGSERARDVS